MFGKTIIPYKKFFVNKQLNYLYCPFFARAKKERKKARWEGVCERPPKPTLRPRRGAASRPKLLATPIL